MSLIKWNRDSERFPSLNSFFDRIWSDDDFYSNFPAFNKKWNTPAVNIVEKDVSFELEVAVPGLERKDFTLSVDKGVLTISAKKESEKEEEDKNYTRKEYDFYSFERSFWLPDNVNPDLVEAKYDSGILKISLPKMEVKLPETKSIEIK